MCLEKLGKKLSTKQTKDGGLEDQEMNIKHCDFRCVNQIYSKFITGLNATVNKNGRFSRVVENRYPPCLYSRYMKQNS